MISSNARPAVARFWAPVVARLARAGVTPDMVTDHRHGRRRRVRASSSSAPAGCSGAPSPSPSSCCWTCSTARWPGRGAAARCSAPSSTPSATVRPTRRSSARSSGGLGRRGQPAARPAGALCLVLGVLTSYIKARAEGVGLSCDVGIVERTERLILVLVGTGFTGLGIPYALHVALWILLVGSAITVVQRVLAVRRSAPTPRRPRPRRADRSRPDPRPTAADRRGVRGRLAGGPHAARARGRGRGSTAPAAGRPAGTARASGSCAPTCAWSPAAG